MLFLHADTRLGPGWADAVGRALADPAVVGGAFRFSFARGELAGRPLATRLGLCLVEWGARLRVALFGTPYGDQAIFVRRSALDALGGVPSAPVMEDLDLVRELKRVGRLAQLVLPATTSPRRYLSDGVLRTVIRHRLAALAWSLGVDRERVASWLRGEGVARARGGSR